MVATICDNGQVMGCGCVAMVRGSYARVSRQLRR